MSLELKMEEFDSPIGGLHLVWNARGVCALEFDGCLERMLGSLERLFGPHRVDRATAKSDWRRRLEEYFAGDLTSVDSVPVESSGTDFQRRVWTALRTIPAGATLSYQGLAERIGNRRASRAVGLANSRNPVAIIQPCHRVIGADARLTGYAGGLERKHWLLRHEGVLL